jgi:hypothetical protein
VDADEEGIGGDDAADALRYLVATKSREVRVRKLRGDLTLQISDPAPLVFDCQPERHRRVRCIWFVSRIILGE